MNSERLRKIRQARENAKAKTEKAHDRKRAKQAKKAARVEATRSDYAMQKEELGIVNSSDVFGWFRARIEDDFGREMVVQGWTVAQKKLAKDLLGVYGPDLVKQAVDWLFDNWGKIQRSDRGMIGGRPTINMLWGYRETAFTEVQLPAKARRDPTRDPKNSDEYRERPGRPAIGW